MTVITIYKCDKCGKEQNDNKQFWTVGVSARCGESPSPGYLHSFVSGKSMQVCRPCLESFGIHIQKKENEEVKVQPPTLEDLIRDIVAEGQ